MNTVNTKQTFLFSSWINCRLDSFDLYKGSDGKIYIKRYGLPIYEITEEWAMSLTWFHVNNTTGWPSVWCEENNWHVITITKEEQNNQCKQVLKLN